MALNKEKKKSVRHHLLAKRQQISIKNYANYCQAIQQYLTTFLASRQGQTVGLYYPVKGEVDLLPLAELSGLTFTLPECHRATREASLIFRQWTLGDPLIGGEYGIPIPKNGQIVLPEVLLIPCVGYSINGYRLGYGAGWYDRTLSRLNPRPITVGVAFSSLLFEEPGVVEEHDIPMDAVVTELGIKWFGAWQDLGF